MAEKLITALMMEAVCTCETSVYFDRTTRRYVPEGCHFHTRRRDNLMFHYDDFYLAGSTKAITKYKRSIFWLRRGGGRSLATSGTVSYNETKRKVNRKEPGLCQDNGRQEVLSTSGRFTALVRIQTADLVETSLESREKEVKNNIKMC
jgi:hypothetical protein